MSHATLLPSLSLLFPTSSLLLPIAASFQTCGGLPSVAAKCQSPAGRLQADAVQDLVSRQSTVCTLLDHFGMYREQQS